MSASDVKEKPSSSSSSGKGKKVKSTFSVARSNANVKTLGFLGAYSLGFFFVLVFVQFVIAKVWGLENSCFKPYPNNEQLLYFDVFQYLRNFVDNFRSLTLSFSNIPTRIIAVPGSDVVSNILGVCKTFANFFIFVFDWVLLVLKATLFYPLYLMASLLGFASSGFGAGISAFLTWWGTQYTA